MREPPPAQLTALLQRLGLATDRDLESVEATVHRIAGDLPRLESVWIDALRHARFLTHFQAAKIHAGRGEDLMVARYVVCQSVHECGYAVVFRAEDRQTRELVRLAVFSARSQGVPLVAATDPSPMRQQGRQAGASLALRTGMDGSVPSPQPPAPPSGASLALRAGMDGASLDRERHEDSPLADLEKLIVIGKSLPYSAGIISAAGLDGSSFWAASPWVDGASLADFVLHHGRFPPEVVLEVARAMISELVAMESASLVHGDIRMQNVLMAKDGEVSIPHAGLRSVIRPHEGVLHNDLLPEACGTLAPERVTDGTPPTVASDLFACGCVWWHMLCGRPPLGGGDTLARLRAAQAVAVGDLHQWASNVPDVLVGAIHDCLQKDPRKRPKSMADLAQRLGPLRRRSRQAIARCLVAAAGPCAPWLRAKRAHEKKPASPHRFTVAALALMAALAIAWPLWVAHNKLRANADITRNTETAVASPQAGRIATVGEERRRELAPRPIVDAAVTPAGYSDAITQPRAITSGANDDKRVGRIGNPSYNPRIGNPSNNSSNDTREELCLPTDRPVLGELLQLRPGQRVRAQGGRARVIVPRAGFVVQADRVSFENVDFVAEERTDPRAIHDQSSPALVRLLAAECDFVNCSFQSAGGSPELSAAIVWQHASAESRTAVALSTGRIRMKNCVFRCVGVGIESFAHGAIALDITNSLYLGPGPMIRLTHAPAADEPVGIHLAQVTLREADALIDCRCTGLEDHSGEIGIEASGCVLAPHAQAALLMLSSDTFPGPLLHEVKWTGQGSVVAGQVVFCRWCRRDGARQTIDDATISIAGLVRGEVEFTGKPDGNPANSQVLNCQAPLQDSESAGATVRDLPPEIPPEGRAKP